MRKINEQISILQNIISRESMNAKTATTSMHRSVYQGGFNQQSESTESHSALGRNQLTQTTTFLPDINQSNSQRAVKMGGVGAVSGPVAKGKTFIIRGKDGQPSMRTVQLTQVHAHHIPRDASSVNFRQNPHTMKDNSSISRFGGVGISGGPSSDHSSSSPQSTKFTNKEYRNARNFNNLYDLNINPKYRDMKEKERLGIRRVQGDRLLPPLEGIEQSLPSIQDQQVTLQKMILRNNDGQVNIKQQVQEENVIYSPSAINTPKNGGGLNLQKALLQKIPPILKKTMMNPGYNSLLIFKSIEIIIIEQQQESQKVNHPLYVPMADLQDIIKLNKTQIEQRITSSIFYDYTKNKFRYENAIKYTDEANKLTTKKQVTIKEPLLTPKKSKIYKDSHSRSPYREKDVRKVQQVGNSGKCQSDALPETIRSSMLLHEQNRDFQVIIKFPCIEFSIHSKNFSFLKLLTRAEILDYLDQSFQQWDELLLKHCFQYRKFNELLKAKLSSPNGQIRQSLPSKPPILKNPFKPMPQSPQSGFGYGAKDSAEQVYDVFVLKESDKNEVQFNHFKGLEEYQRHALDKSENVKQIKTQLKGCYEVGKATSKLRGRIWIKPFMTNILIYKYKSAFHL